MLDHAKGPEIIFSLNLPSFFLFLCCRSNGMVEQWYRAD